MTTDRHGRPHSQAYLANKASPHWRVGVVPATHEVWGWRCANSLAPYGAGSCSVVYGAPPNVVDLDVMRQRREGTRPPANVSRDTRLEVHHVHYRTLGRESLADVVPLCGVCHEAAHLERDCNRALRASLGGPWAVDYRQAVPPPRLLAFLYASADPGNIVPGLRFNQTDLGWPDSVAKVFALQVQREQGALWTHMADTRQVEAFPLWEALRHTQITGRRDHWRTFADDEWPEGYGLEAAS